MMPGQMLAGRGLRVALFATFIAAAASDAILSPAASGQQLGATASLADTSCDLNGALGSPFVPVDSWMYPAILRLYSMGFLDHVFLNMRPWTRINMVQMLADVEEHISDAGPGPATEQASEIYASLKYELQDYVADPCGTSITSHSRIESAYTVMRAITGTSLRDSFHLGSTIINDYGRPYEGGFNNYSGLSGYATAGRFTLYARGEFQRAPSATGYFQTLAEILTTNVDQNVFLNPVTGLPVTQATIPMGPISSTSHSRALEAYFSVHLMGHEVGFGKEDQWLGPAEGASMAYSNNAENIYSFSIDRVDPIRIPGLSRVTGPFRYDFLVGSLKGHDYPNAPWVHVEKISFRPTDNLEFGFERTVIWGGEGHEPVTLHTFLKSFFSFSAVSAAEKNSRGDPGARFGSFDFSYRLPFLRRWLTLYSDSNVHDDLSAIDAPARGAWRPGIYLSHFPGLPRLDARVEAAWTDPSVSSSYGGRFMYWEGIQRDGYTNNGQLFGDWIGREDKGGQAWITYHLSGNEWIQVRVRDQKAAKDFIASPTTQYGTTLNDLSVEAVKRIDRDFEVRGSFTYEQYKAPIYVPGRQTVTTTDIQLTWYPKNLFLTGRSLDSSQR